MGTFFYGWVTSTCALRIAERGNLKYFKMALWTKLSAIALTPKLHNMPLRELEMTRKAFFATNVHVSESSRYGAREKKLPDGPSLKDFMTAELQNPSSVQPSPSTDVEDAIPYLKETDLLGKDRKGEVCAVRISFVLSHTPNHRH